LEELKAKTGLGFNHIINWALVKFMIMEKLITIFEYDNHIKTPHYERENTLPDEALELNKFCDGETCEVDYSKAISEKC